MKNIVLLEGEKTKPNKANLNVETTPKGVELGWCPDDVGEI